MIIAHTIKDIMRMIKDRKALLIILLMPAVLTILLGASVGKLMNGSSKISSIPIAIVDQTSPASLDDPSIQSFITQGESPINSPQEDIEFVSLFLNEVLENKEVKNLIDYQVLSIDEAMQLLDANKITAVITFPESFNQDVLQAMVMSSPKQVQVQMKQNPNEGLQNEIVKGLVQSYTNQLSKNVITKNTIVQLMNDNAPIRKELGESMEEAMNQSFSSDRKEFYTERKSLQGLTSINGIQYYTAGMAVMFMLYLASYAGLYVKDEMRMHTFQRIRASKSSIWDVLVGRFLSALCLSFSQLVILFSVSKLLFSISWGNVWALLLIMLVSSIGVASLAICISVFTLHTPKVDITNIFQSVLIPFLAMLGGSFISTATLPEIIQEIGNNIINGASLQAFVGVMQGVPIQQLSGSIIAVLLNGVVFLIISAFLVFRKKEVF